MESANQNGEASAAKSVSEIAGAGELIGLHADEADDGLGETPVLRTADALDRDLVYGFVEEMDLDVPGVAETILTDNIFGESGEAGEGVAGKNAAPMAHNITVIIILGRLDEIEVEGFSHFTGQGATGLAGGSEAGETRNVHNG